MVKLWQLLFAVGVFLGGNFSFGIWWTAKLDSRVETLERGLGREIGVNTVQTDQIIALQKEGITRAESKVLTELGVRTRERVSVIESEMVHLKDDLKDIRESNREILDILRTTK